MLKYIYIMEDSTIMVSITGPTKEELDQVDDGILQVILCEDDCGEMLISEIEHSGKTPAQEYVRV